MTEQHIGASNERAVAVGDLDALVSLVDRWCFEGDWDCVVDLRDQCRAAQQRGKQLWPAAAYAEYRLALDAPPSYAVLTLGSPADRYTHGPFAEVIASTHSWSDLASHAVASPAFAAVAHERVLRGETIDAFTVGFADALSIPLRLESWEPSYPLARYAPDRAEFDAPALPIDWVDAERKHAEVIHDDDTVAALVALAGVWCRESNGRAEAVAVEGSASGAIVRLGCPRARLAAIGAADALAWMAWTAASGGAHGRRRGMATGRQAAWWALLHLAGLQHEPDVQPYELGAAASEMRWYLWDDGSPATGWSLRMAVEDPAENLAWALMAADQRLEP